MRVMTDRYIIVDFLTGDVLCQDGVVIWMEGKESIIHYKYFNLPSDAQDFIQHKMPSSIKSKILKIEQVYV